MCGVFFLTNNRKYKENVEENDKVFFVCLENHKLFIIRGRIYKEFNVIERDE